MVLWGWSENKLQNYIVRPLAEASNVFFHSHKITHVEGCMRATKIVLIIILAFLALLGVAFAIENLTYESRNPQVPAAVELFDEIHNDLEYLRNSTYTENYRWVSSALEFTESDEYSDEQKEVFIRIFSKIDSSFTRAVIISAPDDSIAPHSRFYIVLEYETLTEDYFFGIFYYGENKKPEQNVVEKQELGDGYWLIKGSLPKRA